MKEAIFTQRCETKGDVRFIRAHLKKINKLTHQSRGTILTEAIFQYWKDVEDSFYKSKLEAREK